VAKQSEPSASRARRLLGWQLAKHGRPWQTKAGHGHGAGHGQTKVGQRWLLLATAAPGGRWLTTGWDGLQINF